MKTAPNAKPPVTMCHCHGMVIIGLLLSGLPRIRVGMIARVVPAMRPVQSGAPWGEFNPHNSRNALGARSITSRYVTDSLPPRRRWTIGGTGYDFPYDEKPARKHLKGDTLVEDLSALRDAGIETVLTPGATADQIAAEVATALA